MAPETGDELTLEALRRFSRSSCAKRPACVSPYMPSCTRMYTEPSGLTRLLRFVFSDDLFLDVMEFNAEVFWTFKWGHQVKVRDAQGHEPGTGFEYDAVE